MTPPTGTPPYGSTDEVPRFEQKEAPPPREPIAPQIVAAFVGVALGVGACFLGNTKSGTLPLPSFSIIVIWMYFLNWVAFVPAACFGTERFYDFTGALTYFSATVAATFVGAGARQRHHGDVTFPFPLPATWRTCLLAGFVLVWCTRLGAFLFLRVLQHKDRRFEAAKSQAVVFFKFWTLQALWATLTAGGVLALLCNEDPGQSYAARSPVVDALGIASAVIGACLWCVGFATEVIADEQKRAFKADPANDGAFIRTGLWGISRHPNYAGEIVVWIGVALVAWPAAQTPMQLILCAISPLFVFVLLRFGSGVPPLEVGADRRWGGRPEYEAYKRTVPVLFPCCCCCPPS